MRNVQQLLFWGISINAKTKSIKEKYTKISRIDGKWCCVLKIGQQSFPIANRISKMEADWFANQLSFALERFLDNEGGKMIALFDEDSQMTTEGIQLSTEFSNLVESWLKGKVSIGYRAVELKAVCYDVIDMRTVFLSAEKFMQQKIKERESL